jgi:hypothetical protein
MKRRTQVVLLVGGLAVATAVASVVVLSAALSRAFDPHNYCETGFSTLLTCTMQRSTRTVTQGTPDPAFAARAGSTSATASSTRESAQPGYSDVASWAVARCPENYVARRLLCAASVAAPAQAASDDLATGLPRPKPWFITAPKKTPYNSSVHVETPLDVAAALGFYRAELSKRGWTENDGAVVAPDRAVVAFTSADGPAQLRLIRQDDRTIVDLSLRKPVAANAGLPPPPGQARLRLRNATDEEAVVTINAQTVKFADRAGRWLKADPETDIDLPPGKFKVTIKVASGAAQNREFEVAADETWDLLVGPDGVPLPVRLY